MKIIIFFSLHLIASSLLILFVQVSIIQYTYFLMHRRHLFRLFLFMRYSYVVCMDHLIVQWFPNNARMYFISTTASHPIQLFCMHFMEAFIYLSMHHLIWLFCMHCKHIISIHASVLFGSIFSRSHPSIHFIHPPTHPSIHLSIHPSIYLSPSKLVYILLY